jgi:hypothetical protein
MITPRSLSPCSESHGKVAERLNAPVLKTDVAKAIEGSNPSLSVFIQSVPELKGANAQINVHASHFFSNGDSQGL